MAARKAKVADPDGPTPLHIEMAAGDTPRQAVARKMTGPFTRHGFVTAQAAEQITAGLPADQKPTLVEYALGLKERADKASGGDRAQSSALLMVQALSLDAIFTECARIALVNVSNGDAMERYMRLALKAQANSRATLEALAKLHQPREQTVRHVHVNEGGQALITDQFHHHTGGKENGQIADQPHTTGTGAAGSSPAMLGHDAHGNGVPIPGDQGAKQVSDARRQGKRRAQGQ